MFETAKRYSEQTYYRKMDLMREMDYHIVAPIWEEVKSYRSIFRIEYPIFQCYLVHNPCMLHMLMKTQHKLMQYVLLTKQEVNVDTLPKHVYPLYTAFIDQCNKPLKDSVWFKHCLQVLSIPIQEPMVGFLCDDDIPLLIRLFFLFYSYEDTTLLFLFLLKEGYVPIHSLLSFKQKKIEKDEQDATSSFLTFLYEIWLKLSTEMVLLKSREENDIKDKRVEELKEMYPILNEEQIRFYVEHRQAQRYYTIAQYMEYTHVCYETARYSMERFVHLHWYQKQKVGKKFIYKVL